MSNRRKKFRQSAVSGFRWLGLFLFLVLSYWWVMTNFVVRDFWDPPFVNKSELLQARIRQYPDHPLWLIMGSSRVDEGLRPGLLAGSLRDPKAPLIFNFGMGGVDLFRQFVSLRRLVADGIKPRRVVIEIPGALMDRKTEMYSDDPRLLVRARPGELDELCGYGADPRDTRWNWLQSRFNPFYEYGMQVANQTLALRLVPFHFLRRFETRRYDEWGWFVGPDGAPPLDDYLKRLEAARLEYVNDFKASFTVSPQFDGQMRALLDYCRGEGFDVTLLNMPEDRDFQAFYPPQVTAAIYGYLKIIEDKYQVRMIDARSWYPDRDNFIDGHHLNGAGAEQFTRRFVRELSAQ